MVEALSAEEFAEEHITGAMNIPLKQLDERAPSDFVDRTLSQQVAKLTTEITRGS